MSEQEQDHVRITTLERSVGRLEERFDNLELQNRATADDVISKFESVARNLDNRISESRNENRAELSSLLKKLETTQDKYSEGKKISWPLIVTIAIAVWGASLVLVGWGSEQRVISAVNAVKNEQVIEDFAEHANMGGHTETANMISSISKDVDRIDERHAGLRDEANKNTNFRIETSGNRFTKEDGDKLREILYEEDQRLFDAIQKEVERSLASDAETNAELNHFRELKTRIEDHIVLDSERDGSQEARLITIEKVIEHLLFEKQ